MKKPNHLGCLRGTGRLSRAVIGILCFSFFLVSCSTTKQSVYFRTLQQKDTTLRGFIPNTYESKIIPGDRISITASSLNPSEDILFNSGSPAAGGTQGATAGGYTVQQDGTVFLHRLGKIRAEGYTRAALAKQVEEKLLAYMKEPIVQVNYLNHKITILGEVGQPQVLNLPEEQISLIDALVLSGDVTANAIKNNITIIREEGNEKRVKHVNLEDNSIFSSPWYYVKPNDIILVSRDYAKADKEQKRAKLQTTLSLVASGVSFLIIILDRVIK
ncbi:MAG: polysaccharide biosynthesis/export family protein [Ferruginibacter sp.]